MTPALLANLLREYVPTAWPDEKQHVEKTIEFCEHNPRAFEREHDQGGHVGSSALVWVPQSRSLVLTRHKVTGALSYFGNHLDGSGDLSGKALARVAEEVSDSFAALLGVNPEIFDVDIHDVVPHLRRDEPVPAHLHYDIMWLFTSETLEDLDPIWVYTLADVWQSNPDAQMQRLLRKLEKL